MYARVTIETTTTGLCCLHQADAVAQSQVFYNRYYRPTSTELHLHPGAEGRGVLAFSLDSREAMRGLSRMGSRLSRSSFCW